MMVQDSLARLSFGASVPTLLQGLLTAGTNMGGAGIAPGSTTVWGGLGPNPAYEDAAIRQPVLVVVPVGELNKKTGSPKYGYTSYFLGAAEGIGGFGGVSPLDYIKRDLEFAHMHSFGTDNEFHNSNSVPLIRFGDQRSRQGRNDGYEPDAVLPRAAFPLFCAIPIEYNDYVYGPWINHPGLNKDNIFPDSANSLLDVENLIGGVKVVVEEGLAPWNYGGMTALDEAVMSKIAEDVNYQQVLENGSVHK